MTLNFETARQLLQERVCSVCTDRLIDGTCGLTGSRQCAFDKHLQQIVTAIGRVDSPDVQDYIDAIREDVCTVCEKDQGGPCEHRELADCALDAYLILVIEAIEEARARAKQT